MYVCMYVCMYVLLTGIGFTQVRLKHIDCLWKLLRDFTVADPFANVRPKYRDPLDEKMTDAINAASPFLEAVSVDTLMWLCCA